MAFEIDSVTFRYYVSTRPAAEQVIWWSRERDRDCIRAMQQRIARNPIRDLLWRRPWRSGTRPNLRSLTNTLQWLRAAHDCSDPSVACSCAGGYRFPGTSVAEESR